jgi:hypothetical protein
VGVRAAVACALTSCALTACAGLGPPASTIRPTPPLAQVRTSHEYPSPTPPAQTASRAAADAVRAIRRFATAYINWNALTVAADLRALAGQSVGQARSALELAAAQTASDYELQRGGIANNGTVEAIAPLPGAGDRYVVVTRESTTATNTSAYEGLAPAWHVALATVTQLAPAHWVVSGWQPEN